MKDIATLRTSYAGEPLTEVTAGDDPIPLFQKWMDAAIAASIHDPNAMTLSTCGADGVPRGRVVLLRDVNARGFVFYTNYESQKAHELKENPAASLCFFWAELSRQVRIEGRVKKNGGVDSDTYFASRPRGHQIGALASAQSQIIGSREELQKRAKEIEADFAGRPIARPAGWGGYCLAPQRIEFWQGQLDRLHDRLRYERDGVGWKRVRLAP